MEEFIFLKFPNDFVDPVGDPTDGILVKGVPKRGLDTIIIDERDDFYTLIVVHNVNVHIDAKRFVRLNRNMTAIILKDGEDFSVQGRNFFVKERRVFEYGD